MAAFNNNSLTSNGLILLAKGIVGAKINFTRIVLGDGYLPDGQTPHSTTDVYSPKSVVDIGKFSINGDGTVTVGGIFINDHMDEGFYYRELGLYAEDPDIGEILYSYGNSGDLAEWIPPTGGASIIQKVIDIVTVIGSAANVTAYIKNSAFVTHDECEPCKALAQSAYDLALEALELAKRALAAANAAQQAVDALTGSVTENTSKISTLWNAVFTEVTTNPFTITFSNLDGVTVSSGVWNATLQRLEC